MSLPVVILAVVCMALVVLAVVFGVLARRWREVARHEVSGRLVLLFHLRHGDPAEHPVIAEILRERAEEFARMFERAAGGAQ